MFQNVDPGLGNDVNGDRYFDQVMRPHVVSYFLRQPNHVLHEDNARTHTALTQDFKREYNKTIPHVQVQLRDLNP